LSSTGEQNAEEGRISAPAEIAAIETSAWRRVIRLLFFSFIAHPSLVERFLAGGFTRPDRAG
jgi:hypothetical protein